MSSDNSTPGIQVSTFSIASRLIKMLVLLLISIGMHKGGLLAQSSQSRQQFLEKRKAMSVDKSSRSYRTNIKPNNRLLRPNRTLCDFTLTPANAANNTLTQIIQSLVGNGVTVSNIQTNLPATSDIYGSFSCGSSVVGIESGLILTSGSIQNARGPNTFSGASTENNLPGSSLLDHLTDSTGFDASVVSFDIVSNTNKISFQYVFGSEEYNEFVGSEFNDVFGFFISGPGITGTQNIALLPNSPAPISINTVNNNLNSQYYINNEFEDESDSVRFFNLEYDGLTTVLTATATVVPGSKYTLTLAIEDVADMIYDCGVFIKGGSITSGPCNMVLTATPTPASCPGATNGSINLTITNATAPVTIQWSNGATTEDISNLAPGTYTATVTDASPCQKILEVTVSAGSSTLTPSVSVAANPAGTICAGTNVTFTATPTNGGDTPAYQWKLNGTNVGTNSATYQNAALVNGSKITCVMTSLLACANPTTATSNEITMTVTAAVAPSVLIAANTGNTICTGAPVTFTATPTNGGPTPAYQWKLNGANVGTSINTYQSAALANGNKITCVMTSSLACTNPTTATSNEITMAVTSTVAPSVSIAANPGNTICAGTNVTFTATPTNGGATPSYQWKLNGSNVGTNSSTYQNAALTNNAKITCVVTSSLACANPTTATSNEITMTATALTTFYRDLDGDGYGNAGSGTTQACTVSQGYVSNNADCNDNNLSVNPAAIEICNNAVDDNCNTQIDEGCTTTETSKIVLRTYFVIEGNNKERLVNLKAHINKPSGKTISVRYTTESGTAYASKDYKQAEGIIQFAPGKTEANISLTILGDQAAEIFEIFYLRFSNPVNVTIPNAKKSSILIIDDDKKKWGLHLIIPVKSNRIPDSKHFDEPGIKVPSLLHRNQALVIKGLSSTQNSLHVTDMRGVPVAQMKQYANNWIPGNLASGIYFYQLIYRNQKGELQRMTGKIFITD